MRIFILTIVFLFNISCSSSRMINEANFVGSFYGLFRSNVTPLSYLLELKPNNQFSLKIHTYYHSECEGTWIQKNGSIFLTCYEETDLRNMLSSSYVTQREFEFKIRNKDELALNKFIVLRRMSVH